MTAFASARKIKIRCVRLSSCDCAGTSAHAPPTIAMPHGGATLSASSRAVCGPIRGVVAASGRPNVWCSVPSPRRPGPRVVLARPRADIGGRSLDLISKDAVLRLGGRSFRLVTPARSRPGERFRTVGQLPRPPSTAFTANAQRRSIDSWEVPSRRAFSAAARPCKSETSTCAMSVSSP